jgi:hypothetical protein
MDLNVKLQGLKYKFGKVQECFCKISRCRQFLGFMDLFSLREIHRICPRDCGPGPPASAHGSMGFIRRQPLATGLTARIKPSEPLSRLLILAFHHRYDGWGDWLRPGRCRLALTVVHHILARRLTGVRVFVSHGGRFPMRFAPTRSQQQGELD